MLSFSLFIGNGAFAQKKPSTEQMEKLAQDFQEAKSLYEINEYEKALVVFKKLYQESQETALLFNIGQCLRMLKQYDEALKTFRTLLREDPTSALKATAEELIKDTEELLAKQVALGSIKIHTSPDSAMVQIDQDAALPTPFLKESVPPGKHRVQVNKEGYIPVDLTFELDPGQAFSLNLPLSLVPEETKTFFKSSNFLTIGAGTGIASLLAGAGALGFAALSSRRQDEVDGKKNIATPAKAAAILGPTSDVLGGLTAMGLTIGFVLRIQENKRGRNEK
jgi:tetratricopeptide (TPR) repeat protein